MVAGKAAIITRITRYKAEIILFCLVTIVYLQGLGGDFIIDDRTYFIDNDLLPKIQPWELGKLFLSPSNYWGEHLPVRDFLYSLQYFVFGLNPVGYHVVSLCLYLLVGMGVYHLSHRLITEYTRLESAHAPLFITAAFLLHPVHVESVTYISGQKDLLCALFSFTSILLFLRLMTRPNPLQSSVLPCFLILYYGAFLSKYLAVSTALVLTIYLASKIRHGAARKLLIAWPLINLPPLAWLCYKIFSVPRHSVIAELGNISLSDKIIQALKITGEHIFLAIKPYPLSFGYPFSYERTIDPPLVTALFFIAAIACFYFATREKLIIAAATIIVVYLLPMLNFYELGNANIYDRYLFMPIFGFAILAWIAITYLLQSHRKIKVIAFSLTVAALSILTMLHIPNYKNDVAVTKNTYALFPKWRSSSFNYADALIEAGQTTLAKQLLEDEHALNVIYDWNQRTTSRKLKIKAIRYQSCNSIVPCY